MKKQGSVKQSLFTKMDRSGLLLLVRAGVVLLVALAVLLAPPWTPQGGKGPDALAEGQAVSIDLAEGTFKVSGAAGTERRTLVIPSPAGL